MNLKLYNIIIISLLLLILSLTLTFLILLSPISLQKALTIKSTNIQGFEVQNDIDNYNQYEFDVEYFISSIPYNSTETIFSVLPKDRFNKSIVNGNGNCSNLVFGAAYYLLKNQLEFQVLHFLPVDNFIDGYGHTVLYMKFKFQNLDPNYGIIDIKEAGIPTFNGVPIDIDELLDPRYDIDLYELNFMNRERINYYEQELLNNNIIAVIESKSIRKYFKFLDKIYVSLGNEKFEKLVYDSIAIIFGYFPFVNVSDSDYQTLFLDKWLVLVLAYTWLWGIRLFIILIIMYLVTIPIFFFKKINLFKDSV